MCVQDSSDSKCYLVCHLSTSLGLEFLRMASFTQAISCFLFTDESTLQTRRVSCLFFAKKSIGDTLARFSTALVGTARYARIILIVTHLCAEDSVFWIAWLSRTLAQTGATWSSFECTTHATSLPFVSLKPRMLGMSQVSFILDSFSHCDLEVSVEAETPNLLYSQVFDASSSGDFLFHEYKYNLRVLEGSSVRDQRNLGLLRSHSKASAVQLIICLTQTLIDFPLQNSDVFSVTLNKRAYITHVLFI